MTRLAVYAGMDPRVVADLDEDEYEALMDAVQERERIASWTNLHEALASVCEALWAVQARLEGGVGVVMINATRQVEPPEPYPRPEWVQREQPSEDDGVLVVHHVGDALRHLHVVPNPPSDDGEE